MKTSHSRSLKLVLAALAGTAGLLGGAGVAHADRPAPGSASPDRLKLPSGPSSVRGLADEPSVDAFGAELKYQVPIELPGGYGGLAPSLALTYSGSLGNGPMGIGWTFAQPKIQRSTRLGVPKFDGTDQLEISGFVSGRLVSIGNGEYRVEGMGQTVRVTTAPGGGFEVDDGKGVHYRLGTSAASRQESDPSHTVAWLVEQESNAMGETIAYEYTRDRNQVYLASVAWGPSGTYRVALAYEARGDTTTSYRSGFPVVTAQRLATISVNANGTERRAYHLGYDTTLPVARLSGVTSTGVAGNGAWPGLAFTYAAPAVPAITPIDGIGNWRLNSNGVTLVDLDGDGAGDLLQLASSGHAYLTNENGTFGGLQTLSGNSLPLTALQLQDVDGDARIDLLQDTGNGWSVWKFAKTRWVPQPGIWPGSAGLALKQPDTTRFADLDGDGISDAIQWSNDGLQIHLATPTGLLPSRSVARIGGTALPTASGRFQDVNGDGLDDYVVTALDHLEMYLGHGDGSFESMTPVAYPFPGTISNPQDIELADLDRDGLLDLIQIQTGTVLWFHGKPDGTFVTDATTLGSPEPLSANVVVAVGDTNGNGSHDVVWSSASGMWRMDLAGATTAGMLVEVTNGLGMDTTFDYRSSHALSAAARASGTAWSSEVPIAMPVPVQKTTALGVGETTRQIGYSVRDGFWDAVEQRFGGFLTTMVTTAGATPAQTSTVNTTYNKGTGNNRELRGKAMIQQVFDGTGKRVSVTTSTWTTMPVAGLPDTPLLRRAIVTETQRQYEDVTPVRKSDVKTTYDALGRATHVIDSGRLDLTGDEAVNDTTFADDDATWVRDVVCEEKTSGIDGVVVSDVQHVFGDDQAELPLCVVGKGWPREVRSWLASDGRYVTQERTTYDAHGNPTTATKGGVTRQISYDPSGLFALQESMTAPSGRALVWQAGWDPVLGVMTSLTDPDGNSTQLLYDALGRYAGRSVNGGLPYEVIEYDWSPPFPKTTEWHFDGSLASVTAKPSVFSQDSHWSQTVTVSNGKGEARYRAKRLSDAQWIILGYQERDPNSRVVFTGRPVYAASADLTSRPTGIVGDTLAYDPLGRLIEQDLANGSKRTIAYVAFERTTQDADLSPVHSVLDGRGRPILTERSLPDGTHEIVQATYDPAGHLVTMTLAGGVVTRTFSYDTLGRLIQATDPDLGARALTWDDGNRLTQELNAMGQAVRYTYDSLGRLATRDAGSVYQYHYDDARPGWTGSAMNLSGKLAWVEEPTGGYDVAYDALGRLAFSSRRIDDQISEETMSYAASGLLLDHRYDDGFSLAYTYDPAGRTIGAGDLWSLLEQDASGRSLHEKAQNGADVTYARDVLGLTSQATVRDVDGAPIYDAEASRNAWGGMTAVVDVDGVGLDHGATFAYDGFAQLTAASFGSGAASYAYAYAYDVLHNMTSRTVTGPTTPAGLFGTYRYGEGGHAPRQLTSIADALGNVQHTIDYDAAGRQVAEDARAMTYDPSDRLARVDGLAAGAVQHAYGQGGNRVKTIAPDGSISYYFGNGTAIRNGVREHDVTVGDRTVARVAMTAAASSMGGATRSVTTAVRFAQGAAAAGTAGIALLCVALFSAPLLRRRTGAAAMASLLLLPACSSAPKLGAARSALDAGQTPTFMHPGFGAGPAVFTDATGHLLEERRYEPFGAPIDANIPGNAGAPIGSPDLATRDLSELNKRIDAATGWSDHGARWLAPETGRWLTPDPPVAAPDAKFMGAPWALHPYQYVNQNPVAYWDPDGQNPVRLGFEIAHAGTEIATEGEEHPAETVASVVTTGATMEMGFVESNLLVAGVTAGVGLVFFLGRLNDQQMAQNAAEVRNVITHMNSVMSDYARATKASSISYTSEQAKAVEHAMGDVLDRADRGNDSLVFDKDGFLIPVHTYEYTMGGKTYSDHAQKNNEQAVRTLDDAIRQGSAQHGASSGPPGSVEAKGFEGIILTGDYDRQDDSSGSFYVTDDPKSSCKEGD